jgi:hypothetical protein
MEPRTMGARNDAVDRIGVERLCVFGLPPVQFVNLAADLGCRYIGTSLLPMPYNPHGYPKWSLRADPALRRDMLAAMHHRGVSISQRSLAEAGVSPHDRVARCVEAARDLLARVERSAAAAG